MNHAEIIDGDTGIINAEADDGARILPDSSDELDRPLSEEDQIRFDGSNWDIEFENQLYWFSRCDEPDRLDPMMEFAMDIASTERWLDDAERMFQVAQTER